MTDSRLSSICAILLAGGKGTRMQGMSSPHIPKQFLMLGNKPVITHSLELFLNTPEIAEIVIVCDPSFHNLFDIASASKPISFALPGERRQDSVYNGLQATSRKHDFVCVHDGARPFIDRPLLLRVFQEALQCGAAAVGMPLNFTVKESTPNYFVKHTPDRSLLWEVQTPQVVRYDWLFDGFRQAITQALTVTDDVSLVELLGKKVKLVEGSPHNLKITVPLDLVIATQLHQMLTTLS